jgi:hypothetical protein
VSFVEPSRVEDALKDLDWVMAMQEELNDFKRNEVWSLVPCSKQNIIEPSGCFTTNKTGMVW